ncbi:MAG: DUF1178 family protein [Pelagibacteraceae bacterium]|jgi:hypothetical protein
MIKYQLKCECGKEFESWFSSSSEFDKLEKKKMLSCICGTSNKITKQIMSPQVSISKKITGDKQQAVYQNVQKKLEDLRNYIEKNAEYVGDKFVSEVRSIHYDKKKARNIYGHASPEQTNELLEEGIEVSSIPWVKKTNS